MYFAHLKSLAASVLLASALTACGNDSIPTSSTTSTSTTVNGQAIAGAVTGNLTVRDANGAQVATASVNAGSFSVSIPNASLSQDLDFEVIGSYTDEVSGQTVTLTATNPLALYVAANTYQAGQTGNAPVTVSSTIIRQQVINEAKTLTVASSDFYSAFGYTPDINAKPFAPSASAPSNATSADKAAAFQAGMFSQFATDIGLDATGMAQLATALAADLADGTLDGTKNGTPVTITTAAGGVDLAALATTTPITARLQIAISEFSGSPKNVAQITSPAIFPVVTYDTAGITKPVTLSDGTTQVNVKLSTTNVAPFMQGFWVGHTTHQVSLTDALGTPIDIAAIGSPITAVGQQPMMWMFSGHHHGAPIGASTDTTAAASGIYKLDTYYVMATAMMNNPPMGLWEYNVMLTEAGGNTTTVTFHPDVKMPMGGDMYFASGVADPYTADAWTNMLGTVAREYRTWIHSVTANPAGGHDLTVFVSTLDMVMDMMTGTMSMPFLPVFTGQTLHGPLMNMMRPAVTIGNVTVDVSADNGTTWQPLTAVAGQNGQYSVTGWTGLSAGISNTVQVRLQVDIGNGLTPRVVKGSTNFPVLQFTAP